MKKTKKDYIIIGFSNWGYHKVLNCWLRNMHLLKIENIMIGALDSETEEFCKKMNIPHFTMFYDLKNGKNQLWKLRTNIIKKFIDNDVSIIHSDIDALWVRNPLKQFFENNQDVIFSYGSYFPPEIFREWNFVLCCGLFMIKSNDKTKKLMSAWQEQMNKCSDDQRTINTLIHNSNTYWYFPPKPDYTLLKDKGNVKYNINCWNDPIYGKIKQFKLKIALLPQRLFQRTFEENRKAFVYHIYSLKNQVIKNPNNTLFRPINNQGNLIPIFWGRGKEFNTKRFYVEKRIENKIRQAKLNIKPKSIF